MTVFERIAAANAIADRLDNSLDDGETVDLDQAIALVKAENKPSGLVVNRPKPFERKGRGTWNEETKAAILNAVSLGVYPHVAAQAEGIDRSNFGRHLRQDPDFRADLEAATAQHRARTEQVIGRHLPKVWLMNGPGRDRPDNPGWGTTQHNIVDVNQNVNITFEDKTRDLGRLSEAELITLRQLEAKTQHTKEDNIIDADFEPCD